VEEEQTEKEGEEEETQSDYVGNYLYGTRSSKDKISIFIRQSISNQHDKL
jgi:hypothetical protein